jgi:hypothetical protein
MRTGIIGLSLLLAAVIAFAAAARAQSAGPSADYKIHPEYSSTSPDGKTTVEQYAKINADGDYTWQFWARRDGKLNMLEPEQPDYSAGFRFTKDSQWLLRMQKTGSGELSLYLYRLAPSGFVTATSKPLDELAWDYFKSRPESRKVLMPDFHMAVAPLKGTEENYRSLGLDWPENRYLALTLSGDNGEHGQVFSVRGWRCRYDLQTGTFDVPPEFAEHNAQAIAPEAK